MLVDSFEAEKILEAYHQGKESIVAFFDLRFTQHKVVFKHNKIIIGDFSYDLKTIQKIAKNPSVFLIDKKPRRLLFSMKGTTSLNQLKILLQLLRLMALECIGPNTIHLRRC